MCFSPTASFITAAVTGTVGVLSLTRASTRRELPLAAMPLIFAIQQCIEGALWLTLPEASQRPLAFGLVGLFLYFAQVFWPVYAPLAILLIEPSKQRQRLIGLCLAVGVTVSVYLLLGLLGKPHSAAIIDDHIVYGTEVTFSVTLGLAYLSATCLPLLLSSRRAVVGIGIVVILGATVTYFAYWEWFASVWCFFAAASSALILLYFEGARRARSPVAG